jgi:hypothetical protein
MRCRSAYLSVDLERVRTLKGDESGSEDDEELGVEDDDSAARSATKASRVKMKALCSDFSQPKVAAI